MTANQQTWFFPQRPQRLVEARQREAERYVNDVLLSLDDETLKATATAAPSCPGARTSRTASAF